MLKHLKINNFALIDTLDVNFSNGMTTITGETGAGKSILLGGLQLAMGKRADLSVIMNQTKKCFVEAVFELGNYGLKEFFHNHDLDYSDETLIRREIIPSGKSRAFINDTPVKVKVLEELSAYLIDIHSQHETQALLQSEYQFLVLDAVAGNQQTVSLYSQKLKTYLKLQKEYELLEERSRISEQQQSLNQFLFDELENAQLKPGMLEPLEARVDELTHIESLQGYVSGAIQLLEAEHAGLIDQLLTFRGLLSQAVQKSKNFESLHTRVEGLHYEAGDIREELLQVFDRLEGNPEELMQKEEQLNVINTLLQKHKVQTVAELISIRDGLSVTLEETEQLDYQLTELREQLDQLKLELHAQSESLRHARIAAIPKLEAELQGLVAQMGMEEAKFKIELTESDRFLSNGKDHLEFNFLANKGSRFKPLRKVASGGELSRIMLSIKTILSRFKKLPTIIFDEIDTGVSGRVSESIAEIMETMAQTMQVFTITHLPQVAARGHHHFKVFKTTEASRTETQLLALDAEARIREIAMMLSGNEISVTALAHAKELLN